MMENTIFLLALVVMSMMMEMMSRAWTRTAFAQGRKR
jgi:hypothetical protein